MTGQKPIAPLRLVPQHSVGRVEHSFNLPFGGTLLVFRAGQRVMAHPELRRAIEQHRLPVQFKD